MNTQNKTLISLDKDSEKEFPFVVSPDDKFFLDSNLLDFKLEKTDDDFLIMTLDGQSYPVEIVSVHQNEYELLINGVGYTFSVESPFSLNRRKMLNTQANESTIIRLKAPMPGKILDVLVKPGDIVKAGDTLVILEAMKMQNAILASTKGTIKKVLAKEGDTTSKSDLLIELEKEM